MLEKSGGLDLDLGGEWGSGVVTLLETVDASLCNLQLSLPLVSSSSREEAVVASLSVSGSELVDGFV